MFWMLPLAGAALGALASKKDPLEGALMGAALGATGGALAPAGLLGGAAGAGAAGAAAAEGAAGAGLLGGGSGAFLGEGVASGIPAWDLAAGSGVDAMGKLKAVGEIAKPAMYGMQAASTAKSLMAGPQQAPAPQLQRGAPLDLSSIFQANQQSQANDMQESERRRKELEQYAMNMMGGR